MKVAALVLGLAAAASAGSTPPIPVEPPPAFAACAMCHTAERNAPHGLGPNLFGIYGRQAATIPGYEYSDAMADAKLVWDSKTLDRVLAARWRAEFPGSRMSYAGMGDPAKRAQVIAYLKSLR